MSHRSWSRKHYHSYFKGLLRLLEGRHKVWHVNGVYEQYYCREKAHDAMGGRYKRAEDVANPFFVIIHPDEFMYEGKISQACFRNLAAFVLSELQEIKAYEPHIIHTGSKTEILPETPKDKTILVCGACDYDCVEKQRDTLRKEGFNAHISLRGTY